MRTENLRYSTRIYIWDDCEDHLDINESGMTIHISPYDRVGSFGLCDLVKALDAAKQVGLHWHRYKSSPSGMWVDLTCDEITDHEDSFDQEGQ